MTDLDRFQLVDGDVQASLDTLAEFAVVMAKAFTRLDERVTALEAGRVELGRHD